MSNTLRHRLNAILNRYVLNPIGLSLLDQCDLDGSHVRWFVRRTPKFTPYLGDD